MNRLILRILLTILSVSSYAQDTIQWSQPNNGDFSVEKFDSAQSIWIRKEFVNYVLFSIEELASNKYHGSGQYTGFYNNGTIAFIREQRFDGEFTELHGRKRIFYNNGNLKEEGQYIHSVKMGLWNYYEENGNMIKTSNYYVQNIDTLSNVRNLISPPMSIDSIKIKELNDFLETIPIVDFGKNGIELYYKNNEPVKAIVYEYGRPLDIETNKRKVKMMLTKPKK